MDILTLILLVVAAICFIVAAFNLVASRVNFIAFGLFLWILTAILNNPLVHR